MTFDPFAAAADDFEMSGCLLGQIKGGLFGLVVNGQMYQVSGANLAGNVGNRVHIVGTKTAGAATLGGATVAVTVTSIQMTDAGGCIAAAAQFKDMTADARGGPGGGGPGMKPKSHTTAIIAGVAVAGAGGGIAAAVLGKSK
jgi:hypothetical protein